MVLVIIFRFLFGCSHLKIQGEKHYLFSEYQNGIPKFKKSFGYNINAKFNMFMKTRCDFILEVDNELFNNRTQKPRFVLCSFQQILNPKLDRLSLQQLEYEMDYTDYPEKYNFCNYDILVTLSTLTQRFFSTKQVI